MTKPTHLTHKSVALRTSGGGNFRSAIVGLLVAFSLVSIAQAHPANAVVRDRYDSQKRALRKAHLAENKLIRASYNDTLQRVAADRRVALKMCEPSRSQALAQIKAARLDAGACFREDLANAERAHQLRLAELEAWYASASRHRHTHTVARPPARVVVTQPVVPQYVVEKTTTYTVPTRNVVVPVEVISVPRRRTCATPVPVNPGYVVSPEVTEGPFVEGPVNGSIVEGPYFDSPVQTQQTEGPILHGPVIEGPVIEGPALESVFPSPAEPQVIQLPPPAVSVRPVPKVKTTTVVTTTVARPAVHVTTAGHLHATDAEDLVVTKRARRATINTVLGHALRALSR